MNTAVSGHHTGLSRIKLFWALSRTPHAVLDISTPALAALLWLGAFPPLKVILLGLLTAFAGYTAVYALNDVIDFRVDRERVKSGELPAAESYLDDVMIRHPMAYGLLSYREGLTWVIAWGAVAMLGAYLLNPVCVVVFLAGCLFETVYCLMLKISSLRTLVSGAVKTSGAVAAVFAVDPDPSSAFMCALFVWIFCWEIGGQNIPHDWADIEEDRRLEAQTVPVRFGAERATTLILYTLIATVALNVVVLYFSQTVFGLLTVIIFLTGGIYLLIVPARRLYKVKERRNAMALFNRSSYYPMALLLLMVAKVAVSAIFPSLNLL
ncbi:MAG: UbiA family prenyltransferase [Thermodesulfobacteriota bacterium]